MISFRTNLDIERFLVECDRLDLLPEVKDGYVPASDIVEFFIKSRKKSTKPIKDFRKAQDQKRNWKTNKTTMMRGINKFHKSTEGKRFHRKLGNFLATRNTYKENLDQNHFLKRTEALNALSSLKTQMHIWFNYYNPLMEDIDYSIMVEDFAPVINGIESKLITNQFTTVDDLELRVLYSLVNEDIFIEQLANQRSVKLDEMRKQWEAISDEILKDEDINREDCFGLTYEIYNEITKSK